MKETKPYPLPKNCLMKSVWLMLLFAFFALVSCHALVIPDEKLHKKLAKDFKPEKIFEMTERIIQEGKKMRVYGNPKGPESFLFIKYMVPLLYQKEHLSMRLWFLQNNSDKEILAWLKDEPGALNERQLLLRADARLCGFQEYEDLLKTIKEFYQSLEDPQSIELSGKEDVFLDFRLYDGDFGNEDRVRCLLHSPLRRGKTRWELPFKGRLYFMMIYDWPLDHYSALNLKESPIGQIPLNKAQEKTNRDARDFLDELILMSYQKSSTDNNYTMTPLKNFITETNVKTALLFFPRQLIRKKTGAAAWLIKRKINRQNQKLEKRINALYKKISDLEPKSK